MRKDRKQQERQRMNIQYSISNIQGLTKAAVDKYCRDYSPQNGALVDRALQSIKAYPLMRRVR